MNTDDMTTTTAKPRKRDTMRQRWEDAVANTRMSDRRVAKLEQTVDELLAAARNALSGLELLNDLEGTGLDVPANQLADAIAKAEGGEA